MRDRFLSFVQRTAWPSKSLDNLLRTALLEDAAAATAAWNEFESTADFDHLTAGEMRLIGLASKRLSALAPNNPMLARIKGIERANWSRSQLAISAAGEGLRVLAAHSIEMLIIKGASRAAVVDAAARGRTINDVDIVVRGGDIVRAFDVLVGEGWRPAGSGTAIFHRSRLAHVVGTNLVRGRFGNLDLHRTSFHPPYTSNDPDVDDASIGRRASKGSLGYAPVWVPSATDAVAIAIAHGALDAHKSSDWLADIAACIDRGVDWDLLEAHIEYRGMHAAAAVALGYIDERLDRPVPGPLIARFRKMAARRPLASLAALAETRPKANYSVFWPIRALSKLHRVRRSQPSHSPIVVSLLGARRRSGSSGFPVFEQELSVPGRQDGRKWKGVLDLTICVELPPASRRIDFEVNSPIRHLARLRSIGLKRGPRDKTLRFKVPLLLEPQDSSIVLAAAPSRSFNDPAPQHLIDKYGPVPFRMIHFAASQSKG
jgi:hypothetical protein